MLNAIRVFASDHYVSYNILLILYITEIYCHRLFAWKGKQNKWSRGKKHSNSRDVWWKIDEKYPLSVLVRFFPFSFHFFLCRINTLLIFSFHMKCCLSLSSIHFFYPATFCTVYICIWKDILCKTCEISAYFISAVQKKSLLLLLLFFIFFLSFPHIERTTWNAHKRHRRGGFLANETWLSCNSKERKENSSHIML